jgi:DNA-binding GntR family transcriptional regulator
MDTGTLADRVYRTLREQILQGQYAPGQKLNIDQLARDLGVSNTPIREAMARLERLGLVEMVPYCGPKIKRLNAAQLKDIYDVRIALEELAVRLVAQSQDPNVFNVITAALEMQERVCNGDDPRAAVDADRAFHDALVQASGNSVLLDLLPNLSDRTRLLLELNTPPSEGMDKAAALRALQDHRRIYEALRKGDQEAAVQELRHQLIRGRENLVAQMIKLEAEKINRKGKK